MGKRIATIGVVISLVVFLTSAAIAAQDGGYDLTSELWAKAVLKTSAKDVTLVWEEVGTDITSSGATVVSGYFYADPVDFAYGSQFNPELFVKVFIDPSGWCNMAFNHVTVDNVAIYSAHNYNGSAHQTGTATLNNRLVEHTYTGVYNSNGKDTFRFYDANELQPDFNAAFDLTGSSNRGDRFNGKISISTSSLVYDSGKTVLPQDMLIQFQNIDTGAFVSEIGTTFIDYNSQEPIYMQMNPSGLVWTPTFIPHLPETIDIGDFGYLPSYSCSDGHTMSGTWQLEDAGNNLAYLVQIYTTKIAQFEESTSKITRTIDKSGAVLAISIEYYYPNSGVLIKLSGSRSN